MTEGEIRSAIFLIERKLARAEAPKDLNVNGTLNIAWPLPKTSLDQ